MNTDTHWLLTPQSRPRPITHACWLAAFRRYPSPPSFTGSISSFGRQDNKSWGSIVTYVTGCINLVIREWKGGAKFSLAFLSSPAPMSVHTQLPGFPQRFFFTLRSCFILLKLYVNSLFWQSRRTFKMPLKTSAVKSFFVVFFGSWSCNYAL